MEKVKAQAEQGMENVQKKMSTLVQENEHLFNALEAFKEEKMQLQSKLKDKALPAEHNGETPIKGKGKEALFGSELDLARTALSNGSARNHSSFQSLILQSETERSEAIIQLQAKSNFQVAALTESIFTLLDDLSK